MRAIRARRAAASAGATLVALFSLAALPGQALADRYVGLAGGAAIPYKGALGWNVLAEIGGHMWGSKHFLGGAEFEFKRQDADATASGAPDVPVDLYNARLLWRFVFAPKRLTPYFGAGGGLGAINAKATATESSELGLSANVVAIGGVNWPVMKDRMSLFGEARFGYTWDLTGDFSHVRRQGFDGFSGMGGIRFRF